MNALLRISFALILAPSCLFAFDSGSDGSDGVLNPNVDTQVPLPDDGILQYTSINIPNGVTVTFSRNTTNTPVRILVSGDAIIDGTIDVSGEDGAPSSGAGDGNVGDDGFPGNGGPGGYGGGFGGMGSADASNNGPRTPQGGIGPGGGIPPNVNLTRNDCFGSGGSFAGVGSVDTSCGPSGSSTYGNEELQPLIGGSGGSGGPGRTSTRGSGGGGGGGGLLVAVSGTLSVNGGIVANGGKAGDIGSTYGDSSAGRTGGPGSGGAIRLVATTLDGNGGISAVGGARARYGDNTLGTTGGAGRIRLEAETFLRTAGTSPAYSQGLPGAVVVAGLPVLRITSVAGVPAPAMPTGQGDIILPSDTPNPVVVEIESQNVPVGNTVSVTLTPPTGPSTTVISNALSGSEAMATASATVDLPSGNSVMLASLSFTVSGAMMKQLSQYTDGEDVVEVELVAAMNGATQTRLITRSGRVVTLDATGAISG